MSRLSALAFCSVLGLVAAPVASAQDEPLPVLTTIKAIRTLSQDDAGRGYPVRVHAIVTHYDELAHGGLIVHDGEFGQYVNTPAHSERVGDWNSLQRGDLVEIEGKTVRGGFAPNLEPAKVRKISRTALPAPKAIPFASMLTGRHDCDYVEVNGVIQRAWFASDSTNLTLFADVAYEEGVLRATFWEYKRDDLAHLIDARVRLRGNVGTLFGQTEQLRGVSLFVGHTSDVVVLEPPPNPFDLPTRTIRSIYNYSSAGEVNRRIRVRGVVTGYIPGHPVEISDFTSTARFRYVRHVLYVEDGTGGARVETEQPERVQPGAIVEVAGFPAVTPGKPILINAVFKAAGRGAERTAVAVSGANVLTPENDATLVRMQGHFLSLLTGPAERILVLKVGETVFDAPLEADTASELLEQLRPGSVVAVTGVYAYQWGPPPSFRLYLRSPADITLIAAAPWWTLRHTVVMVIMFALVASGGGIWIRAAANRKRAQYQAVLNERSRVGRELHDTLEQGLAGIALQLEAVAGSLQASPEIARQSLDVARQMLRYSQEETRRSIMDLRSQALESRDLAGALSDLARQTTQGTGVIPVVRVEGPVCRLDASHEHHLLRIGLEAVTNALKHSGAHTIDILLRFGPDAIELIVQDDGRGFNIASQNLGGAHFGLQGIRERVDKLGGVLHIESGADAGMRLSVTVPAHRKEAATALARMLDESWRTS